MAEEIFKPDLLKAESLVQTESIAADKTKTLKKVTLTVTQNIEWANGKSYGDIVIDVDPLTLSDEIIKELMVRI
jgi:hypothetical protein